MLQSCAASRATHLQLAKAAPQIALVGPTPQNLQAERLGVFLKRAELVNGYPSYTMDGDDSAMLWHAGGSWQVGSAADLGQDRGWVSVRDGCSRPEGSTVTWERSMTARTLSTQSGCAAVRAAPSHHTSSGSAQRQTLA